MDENLHDIDDLFKKAIDEHQEMPSKNVWDQIDKNLDKKKVIFISQKYNKLKWIAAALLIFSAGMAMYTWNTKIRNKELVKQNTANIRKETEKNNFKKNKIDSTADRDYLLDKIKEKKSIEDTAVSAKNRNNQSSTDSLAFTRNENKNELGKSKKEMAVLPFLKEKRLKDVAKIRIRNKGKSKQSFEQQLVKSDKAVAEKKTEKTLISDDNKSISSIKKQKNALENNTPVVKEQPRKAAVGVTELPKHRFYIGPADTSSAKLPVILKEKNKIATDEKPIAAVKVDRSKIYKKPRFFVTLFYSPDIVSSHADDEHHDFREEDRDEIKNKEEIKKTYSAGILIDYNTGKKISFQSGLSFSSIATNIQPKTIFARPDDHGNVNYRFNCSAGYSYVSLPSGIRPSFDGDSISALSSKNILNYITVPLIVKYKLSRGRFSVNPGLGIAVNFLKKGTIETIIGSEKANIDHIEGISKIYLNSSISAGINYEINKNFALNLTPAARFALTSINKDAPFKTYLTSFGLAAGLSIRL